MSASAPGEQPSAVPALDSLAVGLREILRLALPVATVQVGLMLMGVVDTIMIGHLSAQALAAVALGNLYFFVLAIFGIGVLMVLDPVVAQAVGAGDRPAVARGLQRGVVLAAGLSLPVSGFLLLADPLMRLARQPAEVVPLAATYARLMIPGVFPFLVFTVFRQGLQALHRTRPILVTIALANLANLALNWVLIYGHLGLPPLGVAGSAWATTVSRWLMAAGLGTVAWPELRRLLLPLRRDSFSLAPLLRMLRLGLPIGLHYLLETGAFALVALLMGWLGTEAMAGHQVAINLASLTFMVPLGISGAAAVLVGHAVGREDPAGARRAAHAALAVGAGFMAGTAVVFLLAPGPLARLYSKDETVVAVAVLLLPLAGVFQVFDGLQAVGGGILRGLGDTRVPMLLGLLGYWLLGMPVSLYLGFRAGYGPVGLWGGLVLGLAVVAVLLLLRIRAGLARPRRRVVIDPLGAGELLSRVPPETT